jgi:hypothetical protein
MPVSIAINWNTDENFWELHPIMKTIKIFGNLYKSDKSRNKNNSSMLMWAMALLLDPNKENIYRNLNIEDRKQLIKEDFLKDKDFNWEHKTILELVETYENFCLTVAEKELVRFEEKLYQRGRFLEEADYTFDTYSEEGKLLKGTADQLDKMMINTGKLYEHLAKIKDSIAEAEASGNLRGGEVESASEKGAI